MGRLRTAVSRERAPLGAAALALVVIAASARWVAIDSQVQDFDTAKHLLSAFAYADAFERGDLAEPITAFTEYPPVVHVVGAIGTLVGGVDVAPPILAAAIVFVPLLVLGLYRAGASMGGRRTAILAVAIGIGTPMIVTMSRAFILELAMTAMLALAVWALMASRRFEDVRWSLAAGAAVGIGMLTKQTFAFFIAGILVVMVLRGGWRNWRGLLAFAGVAVVLGAPWYVVHWDDLRSTAEWARQPNVAGPLLGARNLSWYGWAFVNQQFLLPLAALVATGAAASAVRWIRERSRDDYTPELIAGAAVGWAALTFYLNLKAPYYALPITVYAALLGAGWLGRLGTRSFRPLAVGLAAVVAINLGAAAFHVNSAIRVELPGANPGSSVVSSRQVTLAFTDGWPPSLDPGPNGDLLGLMHDLKRDGVERLEFDPGTDLSYFNTMGLTTFAYIAGIARPPAYDLESLDPSSDAFIGVLAEDAPGPPGCARLPGARVYVTRGSPLNGDGFCPAPD